MMISLWINNSEWDKHKEQEIKVKRKIITFENKQAKVEQNNPNGLLPVKKSVNTKHLDLQFELVTDCYKPLYTNHTPEAIKMSSWYGNRLAPFHLGSKTV